MGSSTDEEWEHRSGIPENSVQIRPVKAQQAHSLLTLLPRGSGGGGAIITWECGRRATNSVLSHPLHLFVPACDAVF
jgi:hypothetical protein